MPIYLPGAGRFALGGPLRLNTRPSSPLSNPYLVAVPNPRAPRDALVGNEKMVVITPRGAGTENRNENSTSEDVYLSPVGDRQAMFSVGTGANSLGGVTCGPSPARSSFIAADWPMAFPFTLFAHVRPGMGTGENGVAIGISDHDSDRRTFFIGVRGGEAALAARVDGSFFDFKEGVTRNEEWVSIVGVFESATQRHLYVNGEFIGTDTDSVSSWSSVGSDNVVTWFTSGDSTPSDKFRGYISIAGIDLSVWGLREARQFAARPYSVLAPLRGPVFLPQAGGGSNRDITVALASLSASAQAAAINRSRNVDATLESLTISPNAATVKQNRGINAALATLSAVTQSAAINASRIISAGLATLNAATFAAQANKNRTLESNLIQLTTTTQDVDIATSRGVEVDSATLSITPQAATIVKGSNLELTVGLAELAATTFDATVDMTRELEVALATLTTSPQAATINKTREIVATLAQLNITTFDATVTGPDPGVGEQLVIAARRGLIRLIHRR